MHFVFKVLDGADNGLTAHQGDSALSILGTGSK